MGGLQLVAAWGPRLDEHSGHGDHGQTAVVQLGSQLQLSLSRVLCCAGSSCSPEQGLISTASTQSGVWKNWEVFGKISSATPGFSCPSSRCRSCRAHLRPNLSMDCCVSCRRHPKNLLRSSSCFPSCDFFPIFQLLQPSGRTCHKRSHQGTDPGTSKLIKRNNCSNCDATPTSKNQQVGQKLT